MVCNNAFSLFAASHTFKKMYTPMLRQYDLMHLNLKMYSQWVLFW